MKYKWYSAPALVLAMAVLLIGCENKAFKAEKQMWRANRLAQAVYKNPKATPPFQLAKSQDAYRAIIKKYPGTILAVQAQFSIGYLYLVMGQFENARSEYAELINECDKKGNICSEAEFAIGNSYELEGKWDSALAHYRKVMKSYPFSAKSLDLPVHIIKHYMRAGDEARAKLFVDESVSYFTDLKGKSKTEKGDSILQGLIAGSYFTAGQWQDAIDALNKLIRDYPGQKHEEAYFLKSFIYKERLKDQERAIEELKQLVSLYPGSKLARQAQTLLKKFK